jgi:long-chain acyl-CoA synthetase
LKYIGKLKNYNRPWLKFYGRTPANLDYPECSMFEMLEKSKDEYGNYIAIEYMNKKITYSKLYSQILSCVSALAEIGIKKGDKITICLPNIPQAVILFYAVNAIGAVANMIHPLSAKGEVEEFVNISHSKVLFIFDSFYQNAEGLECPELEYIILAGAADCLNPFLKKFFNFKERKNLPEKEKIRSGNFKSWESFLSGFKHTFSLEAGAVKYNDCAAILYSGGTTGTQKGIMLSNLNFNAMAEQTIALGAPDFVAGDSMLAVLPMFHGFGLGVCIHTAIAKAARIILVPRFNAGSFAKLIIKKRPSFIAGVPTLYSALLNKNLLLKADFTGLKGIFSGADTLPVSLKENFDKLLAKNGSKVMLREGYGLTECVTACALTPDGCWRKGSIGVPYPDTLFKIVVCDTVKEAEPNAEGEICIFGPTVMLCYMDNDQETAQVLKLHEDGRIWLHTGDMGYMDEDGFVYFKLRIKRMFKCAGYSVYPNQIEQVINSHPAVSMSCVIGIRDKYKMHKICAIVVPEKSAGSMDEETLKISIMELCRDKIAKWSLPSCIEIRDSIPLTKVGKIAYTELEKEYD